MQTYYYSPLVSMTRLVAQPDCKVRCSHTPSVHQLRKKREKKSLLFQIKPLLKPFNTFPCRVCMQYQRDMDHQKSGYTFIKYEKDVVSAKY